MTEEEEKPVLIVGSTDGTFRLASAPDAGEVRFHAADGSTTLLLRPDGKCFVRGEEVASNRRVYEAFAEWLSEYILLKPQVKLGPRPNGGELDALEYAIYNSARETLPLDIAVDIQRRRSLEVEPGTIRVILETR